MAEHNELGKWGERKAEEYLRRKGYQILERDWRFGHHDLDIVALTPEGVLAIVEVKTRATNDLTTPEEAVNRKKILSIQKASNSYVKQKAFDGRIRFDIIAITGKTDATMVLDHIENAFTPIPTYRY